MGIRTAGMTFNQLAASLGSTYAHGDGIWYSVAETAALIRVRLREDFPGIKASVRSESYSGGASIRVYWTGRFDPKQVESACHAFQAGWFDGMTDSYNYHRTSLNGKPCSFGANYVFVYNREA